ncbi:MAG TPA: hypothetical protein VN229_03715 [Terriglobales bacterium]|nr:hypothetical protein [Terriglobales bacterium]
MTFQADAGGWLLIIVFFGIAITVFGIALSRGRRQPSLSRRNYLRCILGLYVLVILTVVLATIFQSLVFLLMILVPGLFVTEYYRIRFSVQRLSDIAGAPYDGFFRALLSFTLPMVIYLCLRKGQNIPRTDIEVF